MLTDKLTHPCNGCYACATVCPKKCISMKADQEGFWYPVIDQTACVGCGLCESTCPLLQSDIPTENKPIAYAVQNRDETVRLQSSSGGMFTVLAEYVLDHGGIVFGAGFDASFQVIHMAVENKQDLERLRGSKYVQSRIGDTLRQAKQALEQKRMVLFTGTPCQIAGLYRFLGKDAPNLITQDIICHGVPSPFVWKRYLDFCEEKTNSSVQAVSFRDKTNSWKNYLMRIEFSDRSVDLSSHSENLYMRSFLSDFCLRPSCYDCQFKREARQSEFTLADFWGVREILPEMDDDRGTSLVILHSEKAKAIFEKVREKLFVCEVDLRLAIQRNPAMVRSAPKPLRRNAFMKQLQKDPFDHTVKAFCKPPSLLLRAIRKGMRIVKRVLKKTR